MPLSKSVLKSSTVPQKILEYVPPKFELGTPGQAMSYLEGRKSKISDFKMSDVIRVQTGVQGIEENDLEVRIEQQVLEKLKDVQESAYKEAYKLGLDQGRHEAFQKMKEQIEARLGQLDELLLGIKDLKKILIQHNETHLVELAFHMAQRLAHAESKANPEVVVQVMKEAIEMAQLEENITVDVSSEQFAFLEELQKENGRDMEFLKKIKLQPQEGISAGGCVIHTNYSEIDARFEERVGKLWSSLAENMFRVKDDVSST
ncbi:MAG: flagellar assembly protein [Bdellovibrio sp. CG10_big_fil_rev_8_21_14_0_10_47_8]|nr:MAG: flagellar assembly protein [Bdellovibrio sp. CG10_big_fil_rev_8_21_14_0_10_47_8]